MTAVEVTATLADPLDPQAPLDGPFIWIRFANFPNRWAAHIIAGLLENEGVPSYVESAGIFGDAMDFATLWVPAPLAHRARWIMALAPPTDSELIYLSTGELVSAPPPCQTTPP